jgi:hypothetical protein
MFLIVWLVLWQLTWAQACHPECRWQCDDPVCPADCQPSCQPPQCQICNNNTRPATCRTTRRCSVRCPADQCESDQCPACEIVCPDDCHGTPGCYHLCQAPQCGWSCRLPLTTCPRPHCVLQCEEPACAVSPASTLRVTFASLLVALVFMLWTYPVSMR